MPLRERSSRSARLRVSAFAWRCWRSWSACCIRPRCDHDSNDTCQNCHGGCRNGSNHDRLGRRLRPPLGCDAGRVPSFCNRGFTVLALGVLDYQAQRLSIPVIGWVGGCVTVFLPAKPGEEDGGDIVPPGHQHRRAGADDNDGAGVHGGDEFVLPAGKCERLRSYPSDSTFALVPTTTTAAPAWRGKPALAAGSGGEEDLHGLDPFAHTRRARRSAVGDP